MKNCDPLVSFPELAMPIIRRQHYIYKGDGGAQLTQKTLLIVLELEILVGELVAVDRLSPSSITLEHVSGKIVVGTTERIPHIREVSALDHEGFDNAMEA